MRRPHACVRALLTRVLTAHPPACLPGQAIDFGISVFCKPGQYVDVRAGTPIYIAPEVRGCCVCGRRDEVGANAHRLAQPFTYPPPPAQVLRMNYTLSADMWSVGIVAYQLLTGRLPFAGEEGEDVSEVYMSKHVSRGGAAGGGAQDAAPRSSSPPGSS